ncbi:MAG: hypothetical protein ACW986_10235 [Promethearchaeota archaeon]|jgi:hypothetical protein
MFLDKFKESPKDKILYILALAGFLIVLLVEIIIFIPAEAAVSTYGILDYEFAWSLDQVVSIFVEWGSTGILVQINAIYWDFLFIVGYVSLAFSLIVLVFHKSGETMQFYGTYIPLTPILTGAFDVIENILLLSIANNLTSVPDYFPLLASLSASIKFGLLIVGIIYFVIGLLIILINKMRK